MKISILGTGTVGQTLSEKLTELGHELMLGTRDVKAKLTSSQKDAYGNPSFSEWHESHPSISLGTYSEAASKGDMVINATSGGSSLEALKMAGAKHLSGKVLVDVANPLDFSKGMPPGLLPGLQNTNSLGEEIQKTYPEARVVKTLNTIWCGLMVNPGMLGNGDHINYISGNDDNAKAEVRKLLKQFGWKEECLFDLGDITGARAAEAVLPIWLRVMGSIRTGAFNFKLVR